jgi:hypothetical protein
MTFAIRQFSIIFRLTRLCASCIVRGKWKEKTMSLDRALERKIEIKRLEIAKLEQQVAEGRAYISAMEEARKLSQRSSGNGGESDGLRPGSLMYRAREALLKAGKPTHVNELLTMMGEAPDRKRKAALAGSLGNYVRKHEFFTKTGPNTFGLIEDTAETKKENGEKDF